MTLQHKLTPFKALGGTDALEAGLAAYGAVYGNIDAYGDVILPGAVANVEAFLQSGVILLGHDHLSLPVAMPTEAGQDQDGFWFKAQWHSTDDAQKCRTIAKERMDAGKSVGVSIGYLVLDATEEAREGKRVRLLKSIEVHEVSIVNFPANPLAQVTGVKATMREQSEAVRDAVRGLIDRTREIKELREQDGKALGPERLSDLAALQGWLGELLADVKALQVPAAPAVVTPVPELADPKQLRAAIQRAEQVFARARR